MDARASYFLANRIWWSVALLVGPISGAITGQAIVAIVVTALLVLPALVVFDTDRSWWPDAVRQFPRESERTRVELRKLTLWSAAALLTGSLIALIRPWG